MFSVHQSRGEQEFLEHHQDAHDSRRHGDGDAVQGKLFILREAFNELGTVVGTDENKDQDKTAECREAHDAELVPNRKHFAVVLQHARVPFVPRTIRHFWLIKRTV